MARANKSVTPENRLAHWKKIWATPRRLNQDAADAAFDEFCDGLIPRHMHKIFLKSFGVKRDQLNNRFFVDEASFMDWDSKIQEILSGADGVVEATVIYGSPEGLEAHMLKGQPRRTLRDIIVDDWQAACGIVTLGEHKLFLFVEPKMRGCIVRVIRGESSESPSDIR
ncbi:MAG: hypothetical protein P4L46_21120 [Fimbriimonas sp.]|nr:hypothetical protein [Fimbriimonas sp.]